MRLPWTHSPVNQDEINDSHVDKKAAEDALETAKTDLKDTTEKVTEVKRLAKWLRIEREKNHFGPAVEKLLRDGR